MTEPDSTIDSFELTMMGVEHRLGRIADAAERAADALENLVGLLSCAVATVESDDGKVTLCGIRTVETSGSRLWGQANEQSQELT